MDTPKLNEPITAPTPFDSLMRGLIAVPKEELDAEIAKDQKKKAKAEKPKAKK